MNKKNAMKWSLLAPLMGAALALSVSAQAQPGKRLCGKMAALPDGGYAAILTEVKNKTYYPSAMSPCDWAFNANASEVFGSDSYVSPYLASLTWVTQSGTTCESVGGHFTSGDHANVDMCDYMEGYEHYAVVKNATTNTTTYTEK